MNPAVLRGLSALLMVLAFTNAARLLLLSPRRPRRRKIGVYSQSKNFRR